MPETYEILSALDLKGNEIRNVLAQSLASAPGSPAAGQIYYNSTAGKLEVYEGAAFVQFATTAHDHDAVYVNEADHDKAAHDALNIDAQTVGGLGSLSLLERGNHTGLQALGTITGHDKAAHDALDIDADTLDGNDSVYYTNRANHTGTQALGTITGHDKAAHDALLIDADTVDGSQAADLLARANHTGTQTASTISDFDTQVRTSRLDQMAAPTANVSINANKLTNLAEPTNPADAATKAYVDASRLGLDVKESVVAASTANIDLATGGLLTIDGVTLVAGERVLVKDQTAPAENGIYEAAAGAWTRAPDFDTSDEVTPGAFTFVEEGTAAADTGWVLTTDAPITLGTTGLAFAQFSGAGTITAGGGLTKTGSTLDVGAGANITVNADTIEVDQGPGSGLDADTLDGNEATAFSLDGHNHAGSLAKYAETIGDGSTADLTVTHNLGTKDVTVTVRRVSDDKLVMVPWVATSTNAITVSPTPVAALNELRVTVVG